MRDTPRDYLEGKLADGAEGARWIWRMAAVLFGVGLLLALLGGCGGEPDGCYYVERMDGTKYYRCKVNPFK